MSQRDRRETEFARRLRTELTAIVAERSRSRATEETASTTTSLSAWRRRGPRLALGGSVALVVAAAALIVNAGGERTPAAYAVETEPGGGVKIKIYELDDPRGVERALAEAGVAAQVSYLPAGMTCRQPHYTPSMAMLRTLEEGQPQPQPWAGFNFESADGPLVIAIGNYRQRREMDEEIREAARRDELTATDVPSFVVDPTGFRPDQTLVISSAPAPPDYRPAATRGMAPEQIDRLGSGQVQVDTIGQVRVAEGEVGPCEPVPAPDRPAPVRAPEGGWDFSDVAYAGWGF